MQAVAGNRPLRPFRPPMHGDSKSPELKLLWNGSSHARFCHSSDTHLKQSILASKTIGHNMWLLWLRRFTVTRKPYAYYTRESCSDIFKTELFFSMKISFRKYRTSKQIITIITGINLEVNSWLIKIKTLVTAIKINEL